MFRLVWTLLLGGLVAAASVGLFYKPGLQLPQTDLLQVGPAFPAGVGFAGIKNNSTNKKDKNKYKKVRAFFRSFEN